MNDQFFIYNGNIHKVGEPVITTDNRALKYGDGLFETIKFENSMLQLWDFHFERLSSGMQTLQLKLPEYFSKDDLESQILQLCRKNKHSSSARVRLMFCRRILDLQDFENQQCDYIIKTADLDTSEELNSNGLVIDVYTDAKKSCDKFSNIKSNNFLPYVMAGLYAKQINVNDCIVLNCYNRICDTTIANVFIIKDEIIYTPALTEGCIAGVMRRFVIEKLKQSNFTIIEKALIIDDLETADEMFLTNSIRGIRWVKQFKNTVYNNNQIQNIYKLV